MAAASASLPPEICLKILDNVDEDTDPVRCHRAVYVGPVPMVGTMTLVCVYWAQYCRRLRFDQNYIFINSKRQAEGFRDVTMSAGSDRLTPIVDMIKGVRVSRSLAEDPLNHPWHFIIGSLRPRLAEDKFDWFGFSEQVAARLRSVPLASVTLTHSGMTKAMPPHMEKPRLLVNPRCSPDELPVLRETGQSIGIFKCLRLGDVVGTEIEVVSQTVEGYQ